MRYVNWLLSGVLILCLATILPAGCSPTVEPGMGTDAELQELQLKYDELSAKYDNLETQLDTSQANYDSLEAKYEDLSSKYENLSEEYDTLVQDTAQISEEELEQMLFAAINQERQNSELDNLEWYKGLYITAKDHSRNMAARKRLEYTEYSYWQEIFLAVGYSNGDRIVQAALTTWQQSLQYEANFLNPAAKLGAVGVAKSDDIYYITYLADVPR